MSHILLLVPSLYFNQGLDSCVETPHLSLPPLSPHYQGGICTIKNMHYMVFHMSHVSFSNTKDILSI